MTEVATQTKPLPQSDTSDIDITVEEHDETDSNLSTDQRQEALASYLNSFFVDRLYQTEDVVASAITEAGTIPVASLLQLESVKALGATAEAVCSIIDLIPTIELDEERTQVAPNPKPKRNRIILRDIEATEGDIKAIFERDGAPGTAKEVRPDISNTWFVTLETEEIAVNTLLWLHSQKFNDAPIRARMKSETQQKSFYSERPPAPSYNPSYHNDNGYAAGPYQHSPPNHHQQPHQQQYQYQNHGGYKNRKRAGSVPQLGLAHFPPLPTPAEGSGSASNLTQYSKDKILHIINAMTVTKPKAMVECEVVTAEPNLRLEIQPSVANVPAEGESRAKDGQPQADAPEYIPHGLVMPYDDYQNRKRRMHKPERQDDLSFVIDVDVIQAGQDHRTTLMIKNIPNKYSQKMLLQSVEESNKDGFDFIYLPIDFRNWCNVGYAFINFVSTDQVATFYKAFHGQKWKHFKSEKICQITYARIQGKDALIDHFARSRLLSEDKRCRPMVMHDGKLIPLTRRIWV